MPERLRQSLNQLSERLAPPRGRPEHAAGSFEHVQRAIDAGGEPFVHVRASRVHANVSLEPLHDPPDTL